MPEYTILAVLAVVLVVAAETRLWRTGIFRTARYWVSMGIVAFFQVLVDGWLTKLEAPVVRYAPWAHVGVRWPWDIPVEDFLFGFAMVTLAIALWERAGDVRRPAPPRRLSPRAPRSPTPPHPHPAAPPPEPRCHPLTLPPGPSPTSSTGSARTTTG